MSGGDKRVLFGRGENGAVPDGGRSESVVAGIGTKETSIRDRPSSCLQGGNRVLGQLALKHHQRLHDGKQRTRRAERRHVLHGERRVVFGAVDSIGVPGAHGSTCVSNTHGSTGVSNTHGSTCVSNTHSGDVLSGEARDDSTAGVVGVDEELA